MATLQKITPCLWFADQAEEAANYYVGIFPRSRITSMTRYGSAGHEVHGRPPGSVMVVAFELDGMALTALNGGPVFTFNEAISLQVDCKSQDEVDSFWNKLTMGGDPAAQQCGWLKDKYGLSWQIVPEGMEKMLEDPDSPAGARAFNAMMQMK